MKNKLLRASLLTPVLLALLFMTSERAFGQLDIISNVTLEADNSDYSGPCPKDIYLKGTFQVNEGSLGVVQYEIFHTDGPGGAVPLTLVDKGPRTVEIRLRQSYSWTDQVYLRVTVPRPSGPKRYESSRITIKGVCRQYEAVRTPAVISLPPASGRFRVSLTGFVVNHQTLEGPFLTDGAGDEVFAVVNFAELGASNNISGPLETRMSARYGDTSGIGPNSLPGIIQAGGASRTGGFHTGDPYPPSDGQPATVPRAVSRTRLIPMVLWEGELRRGGPNPNAAVIIPTIWENDNNPVVLNLWNQQVDAYLRRFASTSGRFVNGAASRKLLAREDTVLSTIPQAIDFDRPIGIQGDTFNPLAAAPLPATFVPAVMLLTYNSADEAVSSTSYSSNGGRGVIEIRYLDGGNYGGGSYTIFLRVERLPN